MNPFLYRNLIFPAYHGLKKTNVIKKAGIFETNQWKSKAELLKIQSEKLTKLLEHAIENVPYYSNLFEEQGIKKADLTNKDILTKIPLLSKKDINQNLSRLISKKTSPEKLIKSSTSGSTGQKLLFYIDMNSWAERRAVTIRNNHWINIQSGDRSAYLWGAPMDISKAKKLRGRLHGFINNMMIQSSYDMGDSRLESFKHALTVFKPKLLASYPGPLSVFSQYLVDTRNSIPSVMSIITSAETFYPWQQQIIEKAFPMAIVCNRYGSREFGSIAQECPKKNGLHINLERVFIEILNDDMSQAGLDKSGEIVITDLDNYSMPLIRYRIGDVGSLSSESCSCGINLPTLKSVEGRVMDIIKGPNGNRVGGTFWSILFKSRPGIQAFQVIQKCPDTIHVNYVKDAFADQIPFTHFERSIQEKLGKSTTISFEETDFIPKTESGKTRFVISLLNKGLNL